MGNRAAVAFTDRNNPKPHSYVYLHWNGGPESVYPMINALRNAGLVSHSASYATAQFAGLACRFVGTDGLSVGIERFSTPVEAAHTADDNGAYVFNISTWACERTLAGYRVSDPKGYRKLTADEVDRERRMAQQHHYSTKDGLPAELAALLAKPNESKAA